MHTCARNEAELSKCLQEWKNLKVNVTGSVCDVAFRAERERLMATVALIFHEKLNILVKLFLPLLVNTLVKFFPRKLLLNINRIK